MKKDYIIRLETEKEYEETENLEREAFWNVYRPGALEHYVLHLYRNAEGFIKDLDLVIETDGKIVGHVMYADSYIETETGRAKVATFGPYGVLPEYKGKGYGGALLRKSMEMAKERGIRCLCITGRYELYKHFGFVLGKTVGITYKNDPDADYFLVKELENGFFGEVKGTYTDPETYFVDEKEAEEFDKKFPPKQKLKLPGQLA